MTAARLVFWRHGRTEWNATGRWQGRADVPLDGEGRKQAARAALVLTRLEPTAIWSSDLARARDTAEALAGLTGMSVQTDKRLSEIHVGSWEGLTRDEVVAIDPGSAVLYASGTDFRRSPTGETVAEASARVAEALGEIRDSADEGSTVVVVGHGLAGWGGLCQLLGLPVDSWHRLGGLRNGAWVSLALHRARQNWHIEQYNVTADPTIETGRFHGTA